MDENTLVHKLADLFQYKDSYQQQSSGIAPQDMYALERIHFQGKVQSMDLSRAYGIPPSTLTGILDRLEKKQYIRRERKNDDRRAIGLVVTDKGEDVLRRHIGEDRLFARNLFKGLDDGKRKIFLELLRELLENLENVEKKQLFHCDESFSGDADDEPD